MLHIVTVPGGNGVTIAIPFNSSDNAAIAEMLLQELHDAPLADQHIVQTTDGGSLAAVPGDVNVYLADGPGTAVIPDHYQYLIDTYDLSSTYGGGPQANPAPATSFIAFGTLDGASINSETNGLTYTGGTGQVSIVGGNPITTADTIIIDAATTNSGGGVVTLEDGGVENFSLPSGSWNITTGTGTGTITLGTGADTVTANGTFIIDGGSGTAVDRLFGTSDQVFGGGGKTQVFDHGTGDSVVGGTGNETVSAQGSHLDVTGGGGQVLFIDLTGGNTVNGGAGGTVAFGAATVASTYNVGSGYFIYASDGANDTINAASGTSAPLIFGASGADIHLNAATSNAFVVAGSGQETVDASQSTKGVIFFGGSGNTDMLGSTTGSNFYCASTGSTTMSGGIGNSYQFIDHHAGGADLITDFTSSDTLFLTGFGSGAQDGIVSENDVNGHLLMTLSDGTTITFQNLSNASQLDGKIIHN